jgi:hypothetical protein
VVLLAVTFMKLSLPGVVTAQAGFDQCPEPELPLADSAVYAMEFGVPDPPFELDSAVLAMARAFEEHPASARQGMHELVEQYGGRMVAKSLLNVIMHGAPYAVQSENRAAAAWIYGTMHRDYPEFPLTPLPVLLVMDRYDDELKNGLAWATTYFEETSLETNVALSTVLCQTAFHVRPFVNAQSDIELPAGDAHWYAYAILLLRATVRALVVRPGGLEVIERHLAKETNAVLADAIRRWAAN